MIIAPVFRKGGMKQYLRYVLYNTICIVCLVLAVWAIWWFTALKEGFETTAPPFLVLVGKTSTGALYYADVDVPFTPKWQASSLTATGSIGVAYGQLYTVTGDSSVPKVSSYDAAASAATSSPALKQIYVDDGGTIGGIDAAGNVYYGSAKNTNTMMKWVTFSGSNAYGVGTDGSLYFNANPGSGTWTKTNAGTTWKQVVLSGALVCAINNTGNISYAINDITTDKTVWKTNSGPIVCPTFSYISVTGKRLIGVGTDSNIYYTDDVTSSYIWRTVPIKLYDNKGVASTSAAPTFTAIEVMYPDPAARRKRFVDPRVKSCNKSETLIGNYCYQPCPDGQDATGIMCPYLRKNIPAKATCPAGNGVDLLNNTCFNPCPSNYTTTQGSSNIPHYTVDPANNQQCLGATLPKLKTQPKTNVIPPSYRPCNAYDGSLEARYVRIRPTKSYNNNKLCLQNVTVMGYMVDNSGNVGTSLVNLSSTGKTFSTDGTCADGPVKVGGCSFKSGNTYDKNADGGQQDRTNNTYWEVDLGALHFIKSVSVTGCSNTPAGAGNDTLKQMGGTRLQILTTNSASSQFLTERILGPTDTETVTYNYGAGNAQVTEAPSNICYDLCPKVAGIQSVAQGNGSCLLSITTVTNRSITTPQIVRPQVILPPANLTASNGSLIDTTWVADPTDITQYLTCSSFPGSRMIAVNRTIGGHNYSYKNSSTGEVFPNEGGYICVNVSSISVDMCPTYTSSNNGDRPDLMKYLYDSTTISCYIPRNLNRLWSCNTMCDGSPQKASDISKHNISCDIPNRIDPFTYCCTGRVSVAGRGGEQRCWTNTSVYDENNQSAYGMKPSHNFALPSLPGSIVRKPIRMPAKKGCFDSNGDNTPGIFQYNNSCARCVSINDTFYGKGLEVPNRTLNRDKYGDFDNQPVSNLPIPTAFADDFINIPSTANPSTTAPTSNIKLDEQYGPASLAPQPPPLTEANKSTTTIIQTITDGIVQATNFFSSLSRFKPNGLPTVKYKHEVGSFMRTLNVSDVGTIYSSGICLGKCSSNFSRTLPLQMQVVNGKYILWGAACESPTTITIAQDKIPAQYIPGSASVCSENTYFDPSDGYCYTQCNTAQIDNGTTCTFKSIPRPYVSPTYSCTNNALTLSGSVCLYGCEAGTIADGAYCKPDPVVLPNLPTSFGQQVIMCNKTPGGKKSGKDINKWLCEDKDNAFNLVTPPCNDDTRNCIFKDPQVTNPNILYSYVGRDDIICHADSSGSTVYVCQSRNEYLNVGNTSISLQENSQMTCDNLSAAYLDLSNNLSVLASSGSMAQTTATRLANMQVTLQGVFNVLCGSSNPISSCPTLKSQINSLTNSINSGSSTLSNIINPYEMGMSSRTMLVRQMNSMGCNIPK